MHANEKYTFYLQLMCTFANKLLAHFIGNMGEYLCFLFQNDCAAEWKRLLIAMLN